MSDESSTTKTGLSAAKQALLRARMRQAAAHEADVIPRRSQREAPLSFAQQRLWFLDQFYPGSCAYNVPRVFRLKGELNLSALELALNSIIERHQILRTLFKLHRTEPVQVVVDDRTVRLQFYDLASVPEPERQSRAQDVIAAEVQRPFDLSSDLLLRSAVLRLNADEHVLILMSHHIASDGWSKGVMFGELATFYNAALNNKTPVLPLLPIQYADFAVWQKEWVRGALLQKQVAHWKSQLEGAPALLELPTDFPRPPVQGFAGTTECCWFPHKLLQDMKTLSQREGVTLFMSLLASFQVMLSRYTGQDDIVVGIPIAGRMRPELEPLIGDFVNMLALRTSLADAPTYRELLLRVKEAALRAFEYQDLPFENLVEELEQGRDMSRAPVFQTVFILETAPPEPPAMQNLNVEILDFDTPTAKNDLILILADHPAGLKVKLEYRTDLFERSTIQRFLGHYQTLLEGLVADPAQSVTRLSLSTPEEREQLAAWNQTKSEGVARCIHELFEEQCVRTPDAIAVEFQNCKFTYRDLRARANQVAHHLRNLGVAPDSRVGIFVRRSPEMLIALLGIMKAGGAYVPLDPAYPRERLEFMLRDSEASVLVTQESLLGNMSSHHAQVVCLDRDWSIIAQHSVENPPTSVSPANLCYVIYTSGSTGQPKGVQLEHRNVVNFINCVRRRFELSERDTYLGVASMSFDASVLDFYLPLSVGARLVIVDTETSRDGHALGKTMAEAGVTAMHATPSTWRTLVDAGWQGQPQLKIFSGGEALSWELAKELLPRCTELWNLYGPTETAVYSTIHPIAFADGTVLVGRPVNNTQIYILDQHQQPAPLGVAGEICIAGAGVARGYWNRPELTAEKFVASPFGGQPDARMYRTGDLGRYRSDGVIQCLGRRDHQVKLRGFRIELGEIESVLLQYRGVRQAITDVREDGQGDKRLVAYLVLENGHPPALSDLRGFLKAKLPEYMVPSALVLLEHLPVSPNGKLNRAALPNPDHGRPELACAFVPPSSPVEQAVAEVFSEVLEVTQVGLQDDFFELGGHSLLAARVVSRLRDRFQIEITPRFLFESPTVAELAVRIGELLVLTTNQDEIATMLSELVEKEEL